MINIFFPKKLTILNYLYYDNKIILHNLKSHYKYKYKYRIYKNINEIFYIKHKYIKGGNFANILV